MLQTFLLKMLANKILPINASLLKDAACLRRVFLYLSGFKQRLNNNDVEFGSAFHLFKETMRRTGGDYVKSKVAALEYFKRPMIIKKDKAYLTPTFLMKTCIDYWEHYQPDEFETIPWTNEAGEKDIMTEVKFSIPFMVVGGWNVLLQGTWDEIGKIRNGCYAIGDCKTTSSWNTSEFLKSFELSSQLRFYDYTLHKYSGMYPGSIYEEICKHQVGVFVDGIFYSSSKDATFKRSRMYYFTDADRAEYAVMLEKKVREIVLMLSQYANTDTLPIRDGILVGGCETKFGKCAFFNVCASPDNIAAKHILTNDFRNTPYNPLDHNA